MITFSFHDHEELDSTQEEAWRMVDEGASEGAVVTAQTQTRGRGRREKTWVSPRGGLYFSVVLEENAFSAQLPLVAGLALVEVLRGHGVEVKLRWPNDLVVGSSKLGGILCESRGERVVVGVGINAGPLPLVTDQPIIALEGLVAPKNLLQEILDRFDSLWTELHQAGFAPLKERLEEHLALRGRAVRICRDGGGEISGVLTGIGHDGALLLENMPPIHSGTIVGKEHY